MASDPRRRSRRSSSATTNHQDNEDNGGATGGSSTSRLLLSGDDVMEEEDEDLFGDDDNGGDTNVNNAHAETMMSTDDTIVPSSQHPASAITTSSGAGAGSGGIPSGASHGGGGGGGGIIGIGSYRPVDLISSIVTPSPFPHHTTGPTASRYRNSLQRITANPTTDIEAWQAVVGEASTCWRNLLSSGSTTMNVFAVDAETQLKLDWIESCYGTLLKYFPYAFVQYATLGDILWILSARVGEDGGPKSDYGGLLTSSNSSQQRSTIAQQKLETILAETLGYDLEGNPITDTGDNEDEDYYVVEDEDMEGGVQRPQKQQQQLQRRNRRRRNILSPTLGGMCTSSVELWMLYIKTRSRYIKRKLGLPPNFSSLGSSHLPPPHQLEAVKAVLDDTKKAYELALEHAGYNCVDNHVLWKEYLSFAKSQAPVVATNEQDRNASLLIMTPQQHMAWMRSIYQSLVCHPMKGLDQLWTEYEEFEKTQSEQLAAALIPEWKPKYQHSRNVFLERLNRAFDPSDLNWNESWATPPVSSIRYDDMEDDGGEEYYFDETLGRPVPIHGITDGGPGGGDKKRKKRRTKTTDGSGSGGGGGDTTTTGGDDGGTMESYDEYQKKLQTEYDFLTLWKKRVAFERTDPERLNNPKELGKRVRSAYKEMVCVLTFFPEVWHMWSMWEDSQGPTTTAAVAADASDEHQTTVRSPIGNAIAVLRMGQKFLPDSTLLVHGEAQLMERHAVSTNGRSLVNGKPSDCLRVWERFLNRAPNSLAFCIYERLVRRYKGVDAARKVFAQARRVLKSWDASVGNTAGGTQHEAGATAGDGASGNGSQNGGIGANGKRSMVTSRLDPSIGGKQDSSKHANKSLPLEIVYVGPVTWHLYASHATIEHRVNKSPETAAKVFELGLRKHADFLMKPAYVLKYGQLLLELQDTVNLRALLTRALAACGNTKTPQVERLWDMTLQCEELWSISDPTNLDNVFAIERKRRAALMGKDTEDVATGSLLDMEDNKVGSQKTSMSELLVGNDGSGYNVGSMIVNGLSRSVDVLDILGLWSEGGGQNLFSSIAKAHGGPDDDDEMIPGGKSDKSYYRRTQFVNELALGGNASRRSTDANDSATKTTTVRERFQQQGQNAPIQLAIQQSPDWLRPFLLLLPASRLRGVIAKAPPHMVEMALTSLRNSQLPSERPNDGPEKSLTLAGQKRSISQTSGDDSDDDGDTGPSGSGGYGTAFRARQRQKLMTMNGDNTSA